MASEKRKWKSFLGTLLKKSLFGFLVLLFAAPWLSGFESKADSVTVDRKADVVFVIDATGSMSSYIQSVKDNLTDFIEEVKEQGVNVRVRFVVYRDITISGENTTSSGWFDGTADETSGTPGAVNYLSGISASGGGDYEETLLDGLGLMLKSDFGFRTDTKKYCIVLTDATSKPNVSSGYDINLTNVKSKMKTADISLSIIAAISRTDCYEQYHGWVTDPSKEGLADGGILANIDGSYNILLKTLADRMVIGDHFIEPNHVLEGNSMDVKVYFRDGSERATKPMSIYGSDFFVKLNGTKMSIKEKKTDGYTFTVPDTLSVGTYTITANYYIGSRYIETEVGNFYVFDNPDFDVFFGSMTPNSGYYTDNTTVFVDVYNLKKIDGPVSVYVEKRTLSATVVEPPALESDGRYKAKLSFTIDRGLAYPKSYPVSIKINGTEYNLGSFYVKTNGTTEGASGKHLFYDYLYGSPVGSSGITLYANGATVKLSNGEKKNYGETKLYTDILASYIRKPKYNSLLTRIKYVKSSTGKVIVGITGSNVEPTVSKGAIQIADKVERKEIGKIATASIRDGVITITAGKNNPDGRMVYLWVIDTGDVGVSACCPVRILTSPTDIYVHETNTRGLTQEEKKNAKLLEFLEVNVKSSKMIYIDPLIIGNKGALAEATHSTYSIKLKGKDAGNYFSVSRSGNYGFRVYAKNLKEDSKTKKKSAATAKLIIKCEQNKTKATITLKASNMVEYLDLKNPKQGLNSIGDGNYSYSISKTIKNGGALEIHKELYDEYLTSYGITETTDSIKIYPLKSNSERAYSIENGKIEVKDRPDSEQKKITVKVDKTVSGLLRIKAAANAKPGTTSYFLIAYNTTCPYAHRIISVTATE